MASVPVDTRGLEQAARETGRANFLFGRADQDGRRPVLSAERLPDILATMQPTALIVPDGPPRYTGIVGTATLEYAREHFGAPVPGFDGRATCMCGSTASGSAQPTSAVRGRTCRRRTCPSTSLRFRAIVRSAP